MTRKIKSVVWSAGLTVALFVAVGWLVARGYANGFIRLYVQDELSSQLEEPCEIAAVIGNPFAHYKVVGLKLGSLAEVDTVFVRYRMRHLLWGHALVDSLMISGLRLFVAAGEASDEPPWWASEPPLAFEIAHLEISRGSVALVPGEDAVKDISFEGAISAGQGGYRLAVARYGSTQLEPLLAISNLSGLAVLVGGDLALREVALETPRSRFFLSGDIRGLDAPEMDVTFRADSLALSELASLGATGLPDRMVGVDGALRGGVDDFVVQVRLVLDDSRAEGTVRGKDGLFSWDAQLDLKAFEPVVWTEGVLHPLRFDVKATTTGAADTSGLQAGSFNGAFARLNYGEAHFDTLRIVADYAQGRIAGNLEGRGAAGRIRAEVQGVLADADFEGNGRVWFTGFDLSKFPDAPDAIGPVSGDIRLVKDRAWRVDARFARMAIAGETYTDVVASGTYDGARATVSRWSVGLPLNRGQAGGQLQVDLMGNAPRVRGTFNGRLSLVSLLETDLYGQALSFQGSLEGQGRSVEDLSGRLDAEGQIEGFRGGIDSVRVGVRVAGKNSIGIEGALFGPAGQGTLDGLAGLHGSVDLNCRVLLAHSDSLMQVFELPVRGSPISLSGRAQGLWPAISLSFAGQADSLDIADVPVLGVSVQGRWMLPDSGAVDLRADRLAWGEHRLDGFFLDAIHHGARTEFLLGSREGARDRVYAWGRVEEQRDGFQMVLDSLHVQADQVALFNDGPIRVAYSISNGLQIGRFALDGPAGRIAARDHPDFRETIEVVLADMDLRPWTFLMGLSDVDGVLSGELALSGALSDPLIFSEFSLKQGLFYGLSLAEIKGNMSYGQGRLATEIEIQPERGAPIALTGRFPVAQGAGEDIYATAQSSGFDIAMADTLIRELGQVSGSLAFDLSVSGTYEKPVLSGRIDLKEGSVFLRDLNQTFGPVTGRIAVADGRADISSFALGRPAAGANATGHIALDGLDVSGWNIRVQAVDLQPVAWPDLKVNVDAELALTGSPQAPRLSGQVVLRQADIRLLELLETPGSNWDEIAFYRALNMQVRIAADRQVWVRDPDLQVELAGDMDVIKDALGLRVYGILSSRRGFYTFQGRRLRIVQGEIQFQGQEEFDPNLNIRTETEQRLPGEARPVRIYVNVGGTLTYPEVSVSSDPVYSEADILSMLVTGRSTQQVGELLGFGSGSGAGGGGVEDQALNLMLGVAARQLTQRLGDGLNLDLVEVDLGGANISRIRVGKYFGPRLFLSYAQDMSNTGREVGVEFEVAPNLTLEARQIEEVQGEAQNTRTRSSVGVFWRREW